MEGREQTGRVNHALAERINQYILEQKSSIAAISKEIGYDRYLKGVQQIGMTKASKTFLLDCVVDEDRDRLTSEMEEYPGVALSIAGKLTEILGLTNAVNLKKL